MTLSRNFLWFCAVGCIGLAADIATLVVTRDVLGVYAGRVVSFLVAATVTWLLNRSVTFSREALHQRRSVMQEYVHYLSIMATGGVVNYVTYTLLAWNLDQHTWALSLYVAAGSVAGLGVNYLGASRWLYRPRLQIDQSNAPETPSCGKRGPRG